MAHAFFFKCLCNNYQGLHCTFYEMCKKFVGVPLSDSSQNCIRPNTQLQIGGHIYIRPSSFFFFEFHNSIFLRSKVISLLWNPNLEDQAIHFHCLLWLTGLWWEYSNLPPHRKEVDMWIYKYVLLMLINFNCHYISTWFNLHMYLLNHCDSFCETQNVRILSWSVMHLICSVSLFVQVTNSVLYVFLGKSMMKPQYMVPVSVSISEIPLQIQWNAWQLPSLAKIFIDIF
jgi:hypothetical protein